MVAEDVKLFWAGTWQITTLYSQIEQTKEKLRIRWLKLYREIESIVIFLISELWEFYQPWYWYSDLIEKDDSQRDNEK